MVAATTKWRVSFKRKNDVVCPSVSGFPVTQHQAGPRVQLSSSRKAMEFDNAANLDRESGVPGFPVTVEFVALILFDKRMLGLASSNRVVSREAVS
jgi:hypothetical protein